MTSTSDDLIRQARGVSVPSPSPARHHAIVTCMDVRVDPLAAVSMRQGDAHVIRNAGGIVSTDALRSLVISQRKLGTRSIDVMMHTHCGVLGLDQAELAAEVAVDAPGSRVPDFHGFADLEAELRRGVEMLRTSPLLPARDRIRGLVFDVATQRAAVVVP